MVGLFTCQHERGGVRKLCMLRAIVACFMALVVVVPPSAYAAEPVCTVNGTSYEDLSIALDEAPDGASIDLLTDASISGVKRLSKSLAINLGGNTLTCGTLSQSSTSNKLSVSNGSLNGLISVKNLTLDGVTVIGRNQNGGVVAASDSSTISKSNITNTHNVIDGKTSAALSVGGKGSHRVENSTFSGKSAVYVNNPSGAVTFDSCELSGLVSGSSAINLYSSGAVNLLITNSKVTAHEAGKAFSGSWNTAGKIEFGEGNAVSGLILVSGRDNSTNTYELKISGGTFTAAGQIPFIPQAPEFNAQMLERLNVTGGTFDVDVSSVLRSGYQCVKNSDGTWGVYDDVTASGYYTLASDGSKVKHSSIAQAIANGEGTVFVSRNASLTDDDAKLLSSASRKLSCAPGVMLSYDGTPAQLLGCLPSAQDLSVSLKVADAVVTLRGVGISEGKIVACSAGITDKNVSQFEALIAKGFTFDATSSNYRVIATPETGALVGNLWYPDLSLAVTAASIDDASEPISETITMLSDYEGDIEVVYPKAAFTIDFAGHVINGGSGNGLIIAPVYIGGSLASSPDGCSINLKNGKILADGMGIGTNGVLQDVGLSLSGMEVISGSHGMYLAANGNTVILDSSVRGDNVGVELRAGTLRVAGNSAVSGGKGEPSVTPNASGTTASNVAVAVVQHTTKHPINMVIESGSFEGGAALLQADPHQNDAGNVLIDVRDGEFLGDVTSEDCSGFIKGGSFSDESAGKYIAEGTEFVKGEDGLFGVEDKKPVVPPVTDPDDGDEGGQGDKPIAPPVTDPDEGGNGGQGNNPNNPPAAGADGAGQGGAEPKPILPATGDNSVIAVIACAACALACGGLGCVYRRKMQ